MVSPGIQVQVPFRVMVGGYKGPWWVGQQRVPKFSSVSTVIIFDFCVGRALLLSRARPTRTYCFETKFVE
jgi:hypothetical protein